MRKILAGAVVFVAGMACGLIIAYGPLHAQGSTGENDIMPKLNEIVKGQQEIKASLNSIKEELQIIKIRITQSQ